MNRDLNLENVWSEVVRLETTGLETNVIYNEDCLKGMQNRIRDNSIDMILADLPYGTTKCGWDSIIPLDELWVEYERILKKDSVVVLFGQEPFSSKVRLSNIDNYKYDWKWDKGNGGNPFLVKKRPILNYEDVMVFSYGKNKYNPQCNKNNLVNKLPDRHSEKQKSDHFGNYNWDNKRNVGYPKAILKYHTTQFKKKHPTQKPVSLFEYIIKTYTNKDEIVLDNVIGSGTTAIACLKTERQFIGFEKEKEYYKTALKRIGKFDKSYHDELPEKEKPQQKQLF